MGERVVLYDDLDGTVDETVSTRRFALDGDSYAIELSQRNWKKLVRALQPFMERARLDRPAKGSRRAVEATAADSGTPVTPDAVPAQRGSQAGLGFLALVKPTEPELPPGPLESPEGGKPRLMVPDGVPLKGGFGEYKWESDGTRSVTNVAFATAAELNACGRWTFAKTGRRIFSKAAVLAFRKRDARLIPGYAPVPEEETQKTEMGKALARAAKKQRIRAAAA